MLNNDDILKKFISNGNFDNSEIEIEGKKKGPPKITGGKISSFPPGMEAIFSFLNAEDPDEDEEIMQYGDFLNDLDNLPSGSGIGNILKSITNLFSTMEDSFTEREKVEYKLGNIDVLTNPDDFSSIECTPSQNMREEFENHFGKKEVYHIEDFEGITSYGSKLDFDAGSEVKIQAYTEKYVLTLVKSQKVGKSSVYMAFFMNSEGEWEGIVPRFGNTYDPETEKIFTDEKNSEFFDRNGEFIYADIDRIFLGLESLLTEKRNSFLITPAEFGRIKAGTASYNKPSKKLYIGKIEKSESDDAEFFCSDYELNGTEFSMFLKFDREIEPEILSAMSEYVTNVNWNETLIMKNRPLFSENDGELFVNCKYEESIDSFLDF